MISLTRAEIMSMIIPEVNGIARKRKEKAMFIVFVHPYFKQHLTLSESAATFEVVNQAKGNGWVELWDSAPSEFAGALYAAREYDCPVPCLLDEPLHPLTGIVASA